MTDENESGIDDQREYAYWKAWVACKFISKTVMKMSFDEFVVFIDDLDRRVSDERNK